MVVMVYAITMTTNQTIRVRTECRAVRVLPDRLTGIIEGASSSDDVAHGRPCSFPGSVRLSLSEGHRAGFGFRGIRLVWGKRDVKEINGMNFLTFVDQTGVIHSQMDGRRNQDLIFLKKGTTCDKCVRSKIESYALLTA